MHPPTMCELEQLVSAAMRAGDWPAVDLWGEALTLTETLQTLRKPRPTLAGAALWYAANGLRVFPLQPGLKTPHRGTHGVLEASGDPGRVAAWWGRQPDSNIGLATGHLVDVIDIDGPAGVQSWARLLGEDPEPFGVILGTVATPRGTHLYRWTVPYRSGAARLPGIDYRGAGGYVVAPPSVNAEGKRYRWRKPLNLER